MPLAIATRIDHPQAYALGLAATEYEPGGKAADEIRTLWAWCHKRLNKGGKEHGEDAVPHEGPGVCQGLRRLILVVQDLVLDLAAMHAALRIDMCEPGQRAVTHRLASRSHRPPSRRRGIMPVR